MAPTSGIQSKSQYIAYNKISDIEIKNIFEKFSGGFFGDLIITPKEKDQILQYAKGRLNESQLKQLNQIFSDAQPVSGGQQLSAGAVKIFKAVGAILCGGLFTSCSTPLTRQDVHILCPIAQSDVALYENARDISIKPASIEDKSMNSPSIVFDLSEVAFSAQPGGGVEISFNEYNPLHSGGAGYAGFGVITDFEAEIGSGFTVDAYLIYMENGVEKTRQFNQIVHDMRFPGYTYDIRTLRFGCQYSEAVAPLLENMEKTGQNVRIRFVVVPRGSQNADNQTYQDVRLRIRPESPDK
jgi:hypothetical protein